MLNIQTRDDGISLQMGGTAQEIFHELGLVVKSIFKSIVDELGTKEVDKNKMIRYVREQLVYTLATSIAQVEAEFDTPTDDAFTDILNHILFDKEEGEK